LNSSAPGDRHSLRESGSSDDGFHGRIESLGANMSHPADLDVVSIEIEPEPLAPGISDPVNFDAVSVGIEPTNMTANSVASVQDGTLQCFSQGTSNLSDSEDEGFVVPTYRIV